MSVLVDLKVGIPEVPAKAVHQSCSREAQLLAFRYVKPH